MTGDGPPLGAVTALLDRAGVPYMVVGSFASTHYGPPRTTQDLDLVIDPSREQLDAFLAQLDPAAFYVDHDVARDALSRRSMFNAIDVHAGWKFDFIVRKARAFSVEELRRRRPARIAGADVYAATAEDTILAKLEWAKASGSERQLDDVGGIVRVQGDAIDRGYIERWAADLGVVELWERVIRSP